MQNVDNKIEELNSYICDTICKYPCICGGEELDDKCEQCEVCEKINEIRRMIEVDICKKNG